MCPYCGNKQKIRSRFAPDFIIYSLTLELGCDRMIFHTVIVCPFMTIRPNMDILSQMGANVKGKVE